MYQFIMLDKFSCKLLIRCYTVFKKTVTVFTNTITLSTIKKLPLFLTDVQYTLRAISTKMITLVSNTVLQL